MANAATANGQQQNISEQHQQPSAEGDIRLQILENMWNAKYHRHADQISHKSDLAETMRSQVWKNVEIL